MTEQQTSTIWMNVTTSARWQRPPVGIVRVEQELYKSLSALLGAQFKPCVIDNGQFVPYSHQRDFAANITPQNEPIAHWPDPSYDFPFTDFDLTSNELTFDAPIRVEGAPMESKSVQSSCPLKHGDTLISVGLDWDLEQEGIGRIFYNLKKIRGVNIICCCYDLIPIIYPQYCVGDVAAKFQEYFTNITWSSSAILCISERTRNDYKCLVERLGLPQIPTKVIPLGNNLPEDGDVIGPEVERILTQPFILFVSTIERRKNHEVLYRAYHLLRQEGHSATIPRLVFVGMPGWGVGDLLKDIELDPLTKDYIVQLHHVNDTELRRLYEQCSFFVYPSLYEGWGLPVAEALAFGKPVLASERGSIPEVGGDLVQYIDPWSPKAWAEAILKLAGSPGILDELAANIHRQYKPRRWSETALAVKEVIDELEEARSHVLHLDPGYELKTVDGLSYGSRIVSTGGKGIISRGPHISLPASRCKLTINMDKKGGSAGSFSIRLTYGNGNYLLSEKIVEFAEDEFFGRDIEINEFDIPHEIDDFEVVTQIDSDMLVSLNSIKLELD